MDNAFARILSYYPEYKIVTVGNRFSSMLEAGWQNEPRIVKKCGKWSIRETMAFAQLCDVVIGPETGIMNSVAFLDMPKMMFLSHSSPLNIGLNWKNTALLTPDGTPCWPCHKMIYGWENCNRDSVELVIGDKKLIADGAHCQTHITIDKFWDLFKNIA
jgi:ADP-heptose:LPS heptosyltransferase